MTRVALDAMGGDNAPGEIVHGGIEAAVALDDVKVVLVGVQEQVEAELAKYPKEVAIARKAGRCPGSEKRAAQTEGQPGRRREEHPSSDA